MTKIKEILEEGLEAWSKYDHSEQGELYLGSIVMKRLENEIIRVTKKHSE